MKIKQYFCLHSIERDLCLRLKVEIVWNIAPNANKCCFLTIQCIWWANARLFWLLIIDKYEFFSPDRSLNLWIRFFRCFVLNWRNFPFIPPHQRQLSEIKVFCAGSRRTQISHEHHYFEIFVIMAKTVDRFIVHSFFYLFHLFIFCLPLCL